LGSTDLPFAVQNGGIREINMNVRHGGIEYFMKIEEWIIPVVAIRRLLI